jgi:putative salt-induced outer membrane protein YdiY
MTPNTVLNWSCISHAALDCRRPTYLDKSIMILRQFAWLGLLLTGMAGILQADTVVLANSDRLSGQIQKLQDKRLYLKTTYAGVVEIDWSMVQGISSDQTLQFSMQNGRIVTGSVQSSSEGLQLSSLPPRTSILPHEVKAISKPPEEEKFWAHWDGSVELGYDLTRGNSRISQSSVGANAEYDSARLRLQSNVSSLFSKQGGAKSTSTHAISTRLDLYLKPHAFAFTLGSFDRDDAQLLSLRTSIGVGLGWQALRSRRSELSLLGGLTFTNENYRGDEEARTGRHASTGEALLGISLERLQWGRLRFIGRSSFYPSVLDRNRIRVVANAGVRVPVMHHVVWTIRLSEQFDSRPVVTVKKHDYGLISSFGLAF